jgi:hypothetical protein
VIVLTRRVFGMLVLSTPLAFADKAKPALWSGSEIAKAAQGSVLVAGKHIRLRNRATPTEIVMLSSSNDNQRWMLWVVLPKQHENDYQYLHVDNDWWSSQGTGSDSEGTKTTFQLDRAAARRVADAFAIPMHERSKLDDNLRYVWRIPAEASLDKTIAIPIVMRVENQGKTPVGFLVGGRQRGARDNRFLYTIKRNGKAVTIKDAPDFGGLSTYTKIDPGKSFDVTCADLRAWHDLDVPGYYTIEARFEGELSKDGKFPSTAAERAQIWDIAALGQGSILVK